MKIDTFTFQLMIISLPGIIALLISYNLIVRKRDDNFSRIVLVFVYSTLSYLITDYILSISVSNHKELVGKLLSTEPIIDPPVILLSCVVAIIIAFIHSYISNYAILNRLAQFVRCSKRFGDMDVWQYFNNAPISQKHDGWLYVRDHKQELTYYGYITHYSDSGADRELILFDVTVYSNETGDRLYEVEHLYISRNKDDLTIEVPKQQSEGKNEQGQTAS